MLYEFAHIIKRKFGFLWDIVEWGNSQMFALVYGRRLKDCGRLVNDGVDRPYRMKAVEKADIDSLYQFFANQPEEAFTFFHPHGFDRKSLQKIVRNRSFLAFILVETKDDADEVIGYCFLRSFINGSSYRGYMVDCCNRGKGLAKIMGAGMNRVGDSLGLRMFKSISPENPASMKVTQAVCDTQIVRKLDNGDVLIKCMSKKIESPNVNRGGDESYSLIFGFNTVLEPQYGYGYAA